MTILMAGLMSSNARCPITGIVDGEISRDARPEKLSILPTDTLMTTAGSYTQGQSKDNRLLL